MSAEPTVALPDAATLSAAGLRLDLTDEVATVSLAKPERKNCQSPRMWEALRAIGLGLPDTVRVVVVRGDGSAFSAGLDITLLQGGQTLLGTSASTTPEEADAEMVDQIGVWQEGFTWLRDPRFVSIAAVQGHAIGAGFQLALACDLRLVTDDVSFCMKEPALGLVPDLTGTKPLVELVGPARALEMCVTARRVGADEAVQTGLALRATPVDDLDGAVAELVAAILANPVDAVRETTVLLSQAAGRTLDEQRLAERQAQARRFRALGSGGSAGQ